MPETQLSRQETGRLRKALKIVNHNVNVNRSTRTPLTLPVYTVALVDLTAKGRTVAVHDVAAEHLTGVGKAVYEELRTCRLQPGFTIKNSHTKELVLYITITLDRSRNFVSPKEREREATSGVSR